MDKLMVIEGGYVTSRLIQSTSLERWTGLTIFPSKNSVFTQGFSQILGHTLSHQSEFPICRNLIGESEDIQLP